MGMLTLNLEDPSWDFLLPGGHLPTQKPRTSLWAWAGEKGRCRCDCSGGGWGVGALPAGTQKQLINQDRGTPNPSRLWLLPLTRPGPPSPGWLPGPGRGTWHSQECRVGPTGSERCPAVKTASAPETGEGPGGRVTQASQTPSCVGTLPGLDLFLEPAPGLSVEGQGRGGGGRRGGGSWGCRRLTSFSSSGLKP